MVKTYECVQCGNRRTRLTKNGLCRRCQRSLRQAVLKFIETGYVQYKVPESRRRLIADRCMDASIQPRGFMSEAAQVWILENRDPDVIRYKNEIEIYRRALAKISANQDKLNPHELALIADVGLLDGGKLYDKCKGANDG